MVRNPSSPGRVARLKSAFAPRTDADGRPSLWTNRNFLDLWYAESISQVGAQLSVVAIPLLAVGSLHASAFEMGLLGATGTLPYLLFGLVAGAWVDRLPKRMVMMVTDMARGALILGIPVAAAFDALSIGLLLVLSFLVGLLSVFFNASYGALLPRLVRRDQLTHANGLLAGSGSVAQVVGPALGGSLVGLVSAPVTMLVNAAGFFGSGWFIGRIDRAVDAAADDMASGIAEPPHLGREIREGLHALVASPVLRSITASQAAINLAGYIFLGVYVLYMKDDLHLSDRGVGLVFAAGGVGAVIGSALAAPLASRFGSGRTIVWSSVAFGVGGVTVPLAILVPDHALPLVVFAEFAQWLALLVFNTNRLALRQALTPDRLQGRVAATSQVLTMGMQPIGSLLGGIIGSVWSVQAALVVGVIGMFLAFLFVWYSPTRDIHDLPAEPDPSLLREANAMPPDPAPAR
ncbi:MAG TPA: MFS transporter [Thermomicrobiales bacterium]|nr:MFS transporter [Thermomicrobiales bacterium]